jgi:hypothetical protein
LGKQVLLALFLMLLLSVSTLVQSSADVGSPIKVLHVSTFCYNEVQEIINIAGASSLFEVTQVGLLSFNNGNPSDLSAYDVIVFGLSNRFEEGEYTPYAGVIGRISELKNYVNQGGGVVWTHDTLSHGIHDYGVDAEEPAGVDYTLPGTAVGSAVAKIVNEHYVLHHPFEIGTVGDTVSILETHTWYTIVTTATIVMMFDGVPAGPDNFYLTVHEYGNGRVAVIQLGCLTLIEYNGILGSWPSIAESKVFVNTLYWASGIGEQPSPVKGVGGYSFSIGRNTKAEILTPYLTLVVISAIAFTAIKRKVARKTKSAPKNFS